MSDSSLVLGGLHNEPQLVKIAVKKIRDHGGASNKDNS